MRVCFTAELIAAACFLTVVVLVVRWRLSKIRKGLILLPSILWLGLIYLGVAINFYGMAVAAVRQNFIRPAIFLLLLSICQSQLIAIQKEKADRDGG